MPIISWYDDPSDRQLDHLISLFIQLNQVHDCREAITRIVRNNSVDFAWAKQVCSALIDSQDREQRDMQQKAIQAEQAAQQ